MRVYYGWVIVAYGIVATCIGVGTVTALSVFLQPVAASLDASRAGISSVSTLAFLTMGVAGYGWGAIADRFGTRCGMLAGGVLLGLGLLASSYAQSLAELQLLFGVVVGAASGSAFAPLIALTGGCEGQGGGSEIMSLRIGRGAWFSGLRAAEGEGR